MVAIKNQDQYRMLPMGTIVAACMFAGVLVAARLPLLRRLPTFFNKLIGVLVLAAGLWNVFWYALRHLTEFWGFSALVSGLLLIITSLYILNFSALPKFLVRLRPVVLVLLFLYGLLYAITIARL